MRFLQLSISLAGTLLAGSAAAQSAAPPASTPAPASSTILGKTLEPSQLGKISVLGTAPNWKDLEAFAGSLTREEFQKIWSDLYGEANALPPPFEVTQDALLVPTGESGGVKIKVPFKVAGQAAAETRVTWRRAADLPPLKGRPLLSDLHIALDPGHIGGAWAVMEERFLSFKLGEDIREGDMSLLTAKILKERLTELGAVVSLVRENNDPVTTKRPAELDKEARQLLAEAGFPDPKPTYQDVTGDAKLLTVQWQCEKLFYRVSEIHARGQRVNEQLKPDVVLCLHFNAESWGDATSPQFSPKNHLHVLVNGCYSNAELMQQDVRFEMLRRLLGRVHEEELPLAQSVAESMARRTGLPAYIYTTPNARKVADNPYVYARNLLANRIYNCPVVYLEPYVMNHEETYRRLRAGHYVGRTLIGGKLVTSAIDDYVRGVVDGLVNYYQNIRHDS